MKAHLLSLWDSLRSSYWFVPSLMAIGAVFLAFGMVRLDQRVDYDKLAGYWWIYGGGPEGARSVLSTVASSMITIAGVAFSIVIVALTLASSQFGPRLLRNFMRDTGNQFVLGTFMATYIYCLLVLRTVRGTDYDELVPHLAVTGGLLLALISLGVLIFFIHHAASSIQAPNVIAQVGDDLEKTIDTLFPERLGEDEAEVEDDGPVVPSRQKIEVLAEYERLSLDGSINQAWRERARPIRAESSGYLQVIDDDALLETAQQHDLLLCLNTQPGDFSSHDTILAYAYPRASASDEAAESFAGAFVFGNQRTATQDSRYSANQLVEIALRALSPGINDPFTALSCIDWLGSGLSKLASRRIPSHRRYDDDGTLRILVRRLDFPLLTNIAFNQIRQNARTNPVVLLRLLKIITTLADFTYRRSDREALMEHARLIQEAFFQNPENEREKNDEATLEQAFNEAMRALSEEKRSDT